MSQPSCEQLIDSELQAQLKEAREYSGPIYELVYGTTRTTLIEMVFSGGGPSSGFYIYLDEDGDVKYIEYYYKDWFDGAVQRLTDEEENEFTALFGHMWEV